MATLELQVKPFVVQGRVSPGNVVFGNHPKGGFVVRLFLGRVISETSWK